MTLEQYLTQNQIAPLDFRKVIGCGRNTIYRYLRGERIPSRRMMLKIEAETGGAVTANDFYTQAKHQAAPAAVAA